MTAWLKQKKVFSFLGFFFLLCALSACLTLFKLAFAEEQGPFRNDFSGYVKSLQFFTRTSGLQPETAYNFLNRTKRNVQVFNSLQRFRFKLRSSYQVKKSHSAVVRIDYDQQANFGSFAGTGDFRIAKNQSENRQFLDLSQTFVEEGGAFYEHRLYRATAGYETDDLQLEVGRQQIPWGVGYFFTPTDVFNPFSPTQIELDEREGVDAVNLVIHNIKEYKIQAIYTPRGKLLHPQRYFARVTRDIKGFEASLIGGRIQKAYAAGFDLAGNLKEAAVRGELLYQRAPDEPGFFQFMVNADYNLPHNILVLLEYYFNGEGKQTPKNYELARVIRGEIRQMAKNYFAMFAGYDLTPLVRVEKRTIFNLDDSSLFIRPEIRYEIKPDFLLTGAIQFFLGEKQDEFAQLNNLYLVEVKYAF